MEELYVELKKKYKHRFYKSAKEKFGLFIKQKFEDLGYLVITDKQKNIIIGDINNAKTVYGAHYDTPPLSFYITPFTAIFGQVVGSLVASLMMVVMFALNYIFVPNGFQFIFLAVFFVMFLLPNPNNANDNTSGVLAVYHTAKMLKDTQQVAFVLFNLEEFGLIGSKHLADSCGKDKFFLVNYDCVGVGNRVLVAGKDQSLSTAKTIADTINNGKDFVAFTAKSGLFTVASDNLSFSRAIMLSTTKRSVFGGFYLPKVHMPHDNKIDLDNIKKLCGYIIQANNNSDTDKVAASDTDKVAASDTDLAAASDTE